MLGSEKPIAMDLFCGAGGMSLGFEQGGFDVAAAIDFNPRCVQAHESNFPECLALHADLATATGKELRRDTGLRNKHIDVLFGGPPCGGFSIAGQRDPDDPRNKLLLRFAQMVTELKPSYFVVENVRGLLIGDSQKVLLKFRSVIEKAGYSMQWPVQILNSADYGVPQRRQRLFILGCRSNLTLPEYPNASTLITKPRMRVTVGEAIADLDIIEDHLALIDGDVYPGPLGEPSEYALSLRNPPKIGRGTHREKPVALTGCLRVKHNSTSVERFAATAPGKREPTSRCFRLEYGGQSPTLRSGTDIAHGKFTAVRPIHPKHPRCITVREAARLHSFPDWFEFHPTKWHGFMQIGNSVPPMLAKAVARSVLASVCAS